jgi:hypothetical protein
VHQAQQNPPAARLFTLAAAFWVAAIWLALHPLVGLKHDAILYAGQALARLNASAYDGDVFLALSGQDRFTVATALTSRLYTLSGIGVTHATVLLLTQTLSATLLFLLTKSLVGNRLALGGALLYAIAAHGYGPQQVFSVAEPFVTARSFAEPLVWGAVLALRHGRLVPAGLLLTAASLMHPLIALPGWVVWWCRETVRDLRWLWLVPAIAFAGLVAPVVGVNSLISRFDPTWLHIVELRNTVFISQMDANDFCKTLLAGLVLWQRARFQTGEGGVLRAVLLMSILLLGAAAWFADLLRLVLATQLQLWRGLWILQGLGIALWPWWALQHVRTAGEWRVSAALASIAAFTAVNANTPSAPWILGWSALHIVLARHTPRTVALPRSLAFASALLLTLAIAAAVELASIRLSDSAHYTLHHVLTPWIGLPAAGISLASLLGWSAHRAPRTVAAAGALALAASATAWDQRSPLARAVDAVRPPSTHPWQELIAPNTPVLWLGQPEAVWALLERPILHDEIQGAAAVFNRELAVRFGSMRATFESLRQAKLQCQFDHIMLEQPGRPACATPASDLGKLCAQLPQLRFFVAEDRWAPAWISSWAPPATTSGSPSYHLHDCGRLNANLTHDR